MLRQLRFLALCAGVVGVAFSGTSLRGAWQHAPYFHDGSEASLADVVEHYDVFLGLGLSPQQKADLVEFLKSL